MRGTKAAPIIRVSANRADLICFALDAGARGIIVPMVNTKEEAIAMVRACKYSPLGDRSNAGVRGEWGETKDYRSYLDRVNEELVIIPMIETQQAIDNIDEILKFYNLYSDLMKHWSSQMLNSIYEMNYEKLIENPKLQITRLLKSCDLHWDDRCLKFYNNKRAVKTVSDSQVRKKLYKSSMNSWMFIILCAS